MLHLPALRYYPLLRLTSDWTSVAPMRAAYLWVMSVIVKSRPRASAAPAPQHPTINLLDACANIVYSQALWVEAQKDAADTSAEIRWRSKVAGSEIVFVLGLR